MDQGGREVTFNPTAPGAPTPNPIDSSPLSGIACPSVSLCVAIGGLGRAVEGDPIAAAKWTTTPIAGANSLLAISCSSVTECVAVDAVGHVFVGHAAIATAGRATARGATVTVPVRCTGPAGATCAVRVGLSVIETFRGRRLVAVSAARRPRLRRFAVTVGLITTVSTAGGTHTVHVTLNRAGRQLLRRFHRFRVLLVVEQTIGAAVLPPSEQALTLKTSTR